MRTTVGLERLSVCAHQYELAESVTPSARTEYPGAMYLGSCFHRAMEFYFRERLQGGTPFEDDVIGAFTEAWDSGQPLSDGLTKANVVWADKLYPNTTEESSYEDGIGMLKLYLPVASTIEPAQVEFGGKIEVLGEPIVFHIDLLTANNHLIDLKTGRRTKSQLDADVSIQLSVYAWGLRKLGIWQPQDETVALHSVVRHQRVGKNGKVNPEPYKLTIVESRRNLINYEWMDEVFIPRLIAMKQSKAFPANPGTHCAWCPVREHCGHWESVQSGRAETDYVTVDE